MSTIIFLKNCGVHPRPVWPPPFRPVVDGPEVEILSGPWAGRYVITGERDYV